MLRPVAVGEFFGDQLVGRRVVRNPQQRLGQAHQRDTLVVGEPELLQEGIEIAALVSARTRAADKLPRALQRGGANRLRGRRS